MSQTAGGVEQTEVMLLREILSILRSTLERMDSLIDAVTSTRDTLDSDLLGIGSETSTISTTLDTFLQQWEAAQQPPPNPGITGVLTVQGGQSPMALTVDDKTGALVLSFEDDHGDAVSPPPGDGSGLVVTITSDNPAVCTVGAAAPSVDAAGNVTYAAPAAPVAEGSFNAGAVVANQSGAELFDADGTTVFVQPSSIAVPVSAGQAAAGTLAEVG